MEALGCPGFSRARLARHFAPDPVTVPASIGIPTRRDNEDIDELIRRADQLMYDAKRSGRDTIRTDGCCGRDPERFIQQNLPRQHRDSTQRPTIWSDRTACGLHAQGV